MRKFNRFILDGDPKNDANAECVLSTERFYSFLTIFPRRPSGKKRKKPLETAEDFILIDTLHSVEEAFVEPTAPSAAHNFTVNLGLKRL